MTWSELVPLEHAKGPQPIVVSGTIGRPGARPYILIALRPALIHGLPAFLKKPGGIGVSTGSGEHAGRVLLTAKAAGAAHQLVLCTTGKKGNSDVLHLKLHTLPNIKKFAHTPARAFGVGPEYLEITMPWCEALAPIGGPARAPVRALDSNTTAGGFSMIGDRKGK